MEFAATGGRNLPSYLGIQQFEFAGDQRTERSVELRGGIGALQLQWTRLVVEYTVTAFPSRGMGRGRGVMFVMESLELPSLSESHSKRWVNKGSLTGMSEECDVFLKDAVGTGTSDSITSNSA